MTLFVLSFFSAKKRNGTQKKRFRRRGEKIDFFERQFHADFSQNWIELTLGWEPAQQFQFLCSMESRKFNSIAISWADFAIYLLLSTIMFDDYRYSLLISIRVIHVGHYSSFIIAVCCYLELNIRFIWCDVSQFFSDSRSFLIIWLSFMSRFYPS